jgi:hypothetical protein
MTWIYWPLVYTTRNYNLQVTDTQTNVLSLLQFPLSVSWQRILPRKILQVIALRCPCKILSADNSTNWVSGWRPFHTNLLVFLSQADFQLTTDNWTAEISNPGEVHYIWGRVRNCISGFEGSQAVPARPCGAGNVWSELILRVCDVRRAALWWDFN